MIILHFHVLRTCHRTSCLWWYFSSILTESHSLAALAHKMKIPAEENVSPRFELFLLGDDEKKVTEAADTRKYSVRLPYVNPMH